MHFGHTVILHNYTLPVVVGNLKSLISFRPFLHYVQRVAHMRLRIAAWTCHGAAALAKNKFARLVLPRKSRQSTGSILSWQLAVASLDQKVVALRSARLHRNSRARGTMARCRRAAARPSYRAKRADTAQSRHLRAVPGLAVQPMGGHNTARELNHA